MCIWYYRPGKIAVFNLKIYSFRDMKLDVQKWRGGFFNYAVLYNMYMYAEKNKHFAFGVGLNRSACVRMIYANIVRTIYPIMNRLFKYKRTSYFTLLKLTILYIFNCYAFATAHVDGWCAWIDSAFKQTFQRLYNIFGSFSSTSNLS